jgi:hypothetical protein
MALSDIYFTELQNMYSESLKQIEMVKLGDVLFEFNSRKLTIEESIRTIEQELVKYKNENNDVMVDFCQHRIDAFQQCLNVFSDIYSTLKSKKL